MKKFSCVLIVVLLSIPGLMADETSIGIGLMAGYHQPMNAPDSYRAVYGSGDMLFGIICDYRLLEWLCLDFRLTNFTNSGKRVMIDPDGKVSKTENPEDLQIWSLTVGARWLARQHEMYYPYVGLALGGWAVSTKSTLGDGRLTHDTIGMGAMMMLGMQIYPKEKFSFGIDFNYSFVPNMIGDRPGTVSNYYNESDIGGLSAMASIQYRF